MCGAVVHEFAERFAQSHGIRIRFTDEAAILLAEKAEAQGISVRDYCARSFENYQFGLKLILPQPDQEEFLLGPEAVENPDAWLSTRVLKSYRPPEKKD